MLKKELYFMRVILRFIIIILIQHIVIMLNICGCKYSMPKESLDGMRTTVEMVTGNSVKVESDLVDFIEKWSIFITCNFDKTLGMNEVEDSCATVLRAISNERYSFNSWIENICISVNFPVFHVEYKPVPIEAKLGNSEGEYKLRTIYRIMIPAKKVLASELSKLSNNEIKQKWKVLSDSRDSFSRVQTKKTQKVPTLHSRPKA